LRGSRTFRVNSREDVVSQVAERYLDRIRSAFSEVHFSTEKIEEALEMTFTPLEHVIEQLAVHYLNDHKS